MGNAHPCVVCGGLVSSEFGCSHFGFYQKDKHSRHAVCCAYFIRTGQKPTLPLIPGLEAIRLGLA
jgi:hypothetical protein